MFAYFALRVAILLFKGWNSITKHLWGYSFHSGYVKESHTSAKCVLKQTVWWRAEFGEISPKTKNSFFLTYSSRKEADSLLKDEVSLLCLSQKRAYFVEVPPGLDVFETSRAPFCFLSQYLNATHLLSVALEDFIGLAKELGNPRANVVLLSNTGRCGSTILTQMMEAVPNTVVMSEPQFFTDFLQGFDKTAPDLPDGVRSHPEELIFAGLRYLCKPLKRQTVDHFVLKVMSVCIQLTDSLAQEFPQARHIYMHREPRQHMKSFHAVFQSFPWFVSQAILPRFMGKIFITMTPNGSKHGQEIRDLAHDAVNHLGGYQSLLLFWCLHHLNYLEYTQAGRVDFFPLGYEELMADPQEKMSRILKHCHMPLDTLDDCLGAMSRDSQRESTISRENLKKLRTLELTTQDIHQMNGILRKLGLPDLDNYMTLFS